MNIRKFRSELRCLALKTKKAKSNNDFCPICNKVILPIFKSKESCSCDIDISLHKVLEIISFYENLGSKGHKQKVASGDLIGVLFARRIPRGESNA